MGLHTQIEAFGGRMWRYRNLDASRDTSNPDVVFVMTVKVMGSARTII